MHSSRTILLLTDCLEAMRSRYQRFLRTGQDLLPREQAKFCSATRLLHDAVVSRDEDLLMQAWTCLRNAGSAIGSIMIEPKTRRYTASVLGLDVRDLADLCRSLHASNLQVAASTGTDHPIASGRKA
ncbi:hypothetical protein FFK22_027305 [Mycobacterium sp. KBS0706]|jgi:hypothetical protein|uniref:hypothetical protein n=1 Tax=Mycobacterium sp. KBS0706 TaxID=2578109 RepID=UPI00110F8508|nr:hypothetical protein [Mycobacterium sp. KBS0706]TSD85472.1 hypothetical protein FFK22_027305 [Mycobacterium sp. KBS0706]